MTVLSKTYASSRLTTMKTIFLILSIVLPLFSPVVYIRSILHGESKPHRTTRFVYLITGILTTLSLLASHNYVALAISLVSTIQAITLLSLSFRYGMGGWSKTDVICLLLSIAGIVEWQTTKNPMFGLYFGMLADFAGTVPTIMKTYHHPETEIWQFYGIDALAATFNFLALQSFTSATYSYPLYLVCINGLIALLAIRGKRDHLLTIVSGS